MRVLLAEDDVMIGASVRRGLSQDGFTVDWVEDGRAAEIALAERVHDAVLLDLGLPRKSGLEVLSAMRRGGDTRPVLIMAPEVHRSNFSLAQRGIGIVRT